MDNLDVVRNTWESEHQELLRSERVLAALRQARQSLQQRQEELVEECASLREEVAQDPRVAACVALEHEIEALQASLESFGPKKFALVREQQAQLQAFEASKAQEAELRQELMGLDKVEQGLQNDLHAVRAKGTEVEQQAKSLVDSEVLLRAEAQARELQMDLQAAELEASQMRQKLAESWVTDGANRSSGDLENLEEMERALQWLVKTQQAADSERQLVERLERKEAGLQRRLREVSQEKANLTSMRVDLGDAGKAMRETMASQSEGYVKELASLEEARRITFSDRVKLMQDCADLQDKLDSMRSAEAGGALLRGRHTKLQATCRSVADQSQRLRDMNAVLGALLLGDELEVDDRISDMDADETTVVMRVLTLLKKLLDRQDSYHREKEQLSERIRSLERAAALPGSADRSAESPAEVADAPGLASSIKSRVAQWRDVLTQNVRRCATVVPSFGVFLLLCQNWVTKHHRQLLEMQFLSQSFVMLHHLTLITLLNLC
ncbi:unnamed protein product [Durusdinium trenchii]|uniref:Uncharacterized protein n=1 Tax=Durusdinium trenchii TaxID=1381693 RepID=A0ABP0N7N2_9DINO